MEELVVKNFGAIVDAKFTLKPLTVFIGNSGTGKSTLGKLISIFRDKRLWTEDTSFEESLEYHGILSYRTKDTYISYKCDYGSFSTANGVSFSGYFFEKAIDERNNEIDGKELLKMLSDSVYQSFEIPAERLMATSIAEGYASLDRNTNLKGFFSPAFLDFVAAYNEIRSQITQKELPIFGVTYEVGKDGKEYLRLPEQHSVLLSKAASGMQATIPAMLVLEQYAKDKGNKRSFFFEEPELNLFPTAQKALVEFMAEKVLNSGHQLVICTHSPYILTSLNNLLYAYELGEKKGKKGVSEVIPMKNWVSIDSTAAYILQAEGGAEPIFSEEYFMFDTGKIDEAGDLNNHNFGKLSDIDFSDDV